MSADGYPAESGSIDDAVPYQQPGQVLPAPRLVMRRPDVGLVAEVERLTRELAEAVEDIRRNVVVRDAAVAENRRLADEVERLRVRAVAEVTVLSKSVDLLQSAGREQRAALAAARAERDGYLADRDRWKVEAGRLRGLLDEALGGWAFACDTMHRANCFDWHSPEHCRDPRIAEVRRDAGLP